MYEYDGGNKEFTPNFTREVLGKYSLGRTREG
jgi:hypothetical protein